MLLVPFPTFHCLLKMGDSFSGHPEQTPEQLSRSGSPARSEGAISRYLGKMPAPELFRSCQNASRHPLKRKDVKKRSVPRIQLLASNCQINPPPLPFMTVIFHLAN